MPGAAAEEGRNCGAVSGAPLLPAADFHQGRELPAHDAHPVHPGRGAEGGGVCRCARQLHQEGGGSQGG